jgi:hypothetical protein
MHLMPRTVEFRMRAYPEREGPEYGLWESNLNVLTRNDRGQGFDPIYGGPQLRGFLCKVYRAEEAP